MQPRDSSPIERTDGTLNEDDSVKRPATELRAKLDDADFVARLQSGDEDALDELTAWLYLKLPGFITFIFRHKIKNENVTTEHVHKWATDLLFQIRTRLHRYEYRGPRTFLNWMRTVIRNKVIDELRKHGSPPKTVEFSEEEHSLTSLFEHATDVFPDYEVNFPIGTVSNEQGADELAPAGPLSAEEELALRALTYLDDRYIWILISTLKEGKDYETIAREELAREYQGAPIPDGALKRRIVALRQLRSRAMKRFSQIMADLRAGKRVRKKRTRSS